MAAIMVVLTLGVFALWYYVVIVPIEQAAALKQAHAEALEKELRAKYCTGDSYENEIVRRFCAVKK